MKIKRSLNRGLVLFSSLFFFLASLQASAAGNYWVIGTSDEPESAWLYFTDLLSACVYGQQFQNDLWAANNVPDYWRIRPPIVGLTDDGLHATCTGAYPAYENGGFDYRNLGRLQGSCPQFSLKKNNTCYTPPKSIGKPDNCCSMPQLGDPISVSTGNLFLEQVDYGSPTGLQLVRYYNSAFHLDDTSGTSPIGTPNWRHSFNRSVVGSGSQQIIYRPDGKSFTYSYNPSTNSWTTDSDTKSVLTQLSQNSGWQFFDNQTDETETYNVTGKLIQILSRSGYIRTLAYGDGVNSAPIGALFSVTDSFGRKIQFGYDAVGRISQVITPDSGLIKYTYTTDAIGMLSSVLYPDNKVLQYIYNESDKVPSQFTFSNSLTGIVDENSNRFASFRYDTSNRAISSEHDIIVGGVPVPVQSHVFTYGEDGSTTVVNAANTVQAFYFSFNS